MLIHPYHMDHIIFNQYFFFLKNYPIANFGNCCAILISNDAFKTKKSIEIAKENKEQLKAFLPQYGFDVKEINNKVEIVSTVI